MKKILLLFLFAMVGWSAKALYTPTPPCTSAMSPATQLANDDAITPTAKAVLGQIIVSNLTPGSVVTLQNVLGQTYYNSVAQSTEVIIDAPNIGMWVVSVGGTLIGKINVVMPEPLITLTAQVDGNERTLSFAANTEGQAVRIDWGNGKMTDVTGIPAMDDYGTTLGITGTPVGEGNIKIYATDLAVFGCNSRVDGAQVTALDVTNATGLVELDCYTNAITTLDLSKNTTLKKLNCYNNLISELDLSHNTELTRLDAKQMKLTGIDLTGNTALTYLALNFNEIERIDLSANQALASLYALNCGLTDITLPNTESLTYISLNNNKLQTLDVTPCKGLTTLFCLNNQLTELKAGDISKSVNISGNLFTLATLPVMTPKTYTYAPQADLLIAETIETGMELDLSAYNNLTGVAAGPQATTYTWKDEDGNALEAGTDYTEDQGRFTFIKAQDKPVYCEMATAAWPKFTGNNTFKTTNITVEAAPDPLITLTAQVDGNERLLTFAASTEGQQVSIDWGNGERTEPTDIPMMDDYGTTLAIGGKPVGEGIIKIYATDLAVFGCDSRVDGAQVTALDVTKATGLVELNCYSNSIETLDLSHNTALKKLNCYNNLISELDLSHNTGLTRLDAKQMKLTGIDLTGNTALTYLALNFNEIERIDLSANQALASLYALNCGLTDITLPNTESLTYISLNNNKLQTLDVTPCKGLTTLFCLNNQLTELKAGDISKSVNISGNLFTLATLPVMTPKTYTYAPQAALQIAETIETGVELDLSAYNNLTGLAAEPKPTTYTWKNEDGNVLVAGTDYTEDAGRFTFIKAQDKPVYCEMTTAAWPKFTGNNTFKTTNITVEAAPDPLITLTAQVDGNERLLTFAASTEGQQVSIDWGNGERTEPTDIPMMDDYGTTLAIGGKPVGEGIIKIYATDLAVFGCDSRVDGAQVTALDVTNATGLVELNCYTNSIETLDLSHNTALKKLNCYNNPISVLDLSHNTELTRLDAKQMKLTGIELTGNTALTYLALSNNEIEHIDLSANQALANLYLLNCGLTDIKLPNTESLTYISLNNNKLQTIDVTPCKGLATLFCLNNQLTELKAGDISKSVNISGNLFTLATLPVMTPKTYTYAPQADLLIAETIETGMELDLSAYNNLTGLAAGPQATTYTWKDEDGNALEAGTDYTEDQGRFTFIKAQDKPVYCEMTTAAWPSFTGTKAYKTTAITVTLADAIQQAKQGVATIQATRGQIAVSHLTPGSRVTLINMQGMTIADTKVSTTEMTFSVKEGLYILVINGEATKLSAF